MLFMKKSIIMTFETELCVGGVTCSEMAGLSFPRCIENINHLLMEKFIKIYGS